MKNVEQLSFFEREDPFKIEKEWMDKYPSTEKKPEKKGRKRIAKDETYLAFYREGVELNSDIGTQTEDKRRLLMRYFPARFGDKGEQPLKTGTNYQIGTIFIGLRDYARERLGYQ